VPIRDGEVAAPCADAPSDPNKKAAVQPRVVAAAPVRLRGLVKLTFDDHLVAPVVRPLSGGEAFQSLSLALIRFILDDECVQLRDFSFLADLAAACPMFELARPKRLELADNAVDHLLRIAGDFDE
jgi:hypothetical protein